MQRRKSARLPLYKSALYRALLERVGTNLRLLREARAWSQEEAAFQCGDMAPPYFRRIELGGTNVTALTLARLCEGLGVDAAALFVPLPPAPKAAVKRKPGRPRKEKSTE